MAVSWFRVRRCDNADRKKKRPEDNYNFSQHPYSVNQSGATERSVIPPVVHFVDDGF
jgi:hypothetical protein